MDEELEKLERKFANQLDKYWASMRSQLELCRRSRRVGTTQWYEMRDELQHILDSGILSYPQTFREARLQPDMPYKDKRQVLGLRLREYIRTPEEVRFMQNMAYKAQEMRKSNWSWRIAEEAEEKHKLGWHPFFVTLTVDPKITDPEKLWKEGREFRKYIRRLSNVVCKQLDHPPAHKKVKYKGKQWDYRPESDYVTYAGVIEHGKSREHHHGHFLIWLRAIPHTWAVCPNTGLLPANSTKNECLPMRTLWSWSAPKLSPSLYFRYQGDIWEREYNFVLPLKDGQPMKISNPRVAGMYITKYLSKEHKQWHHRMKATRNLGMMKIRMVLKHLSDSQVRALTWRPKDPNSNHLIQKIHGVPLGLLRSLATRENFYRDFKSNRLDFKTLLQSNSGVWMKMLTSVQHGARPDRMTSQEFFAWVGERLPVPKEFCEKSQFEAHALMQAHFPKEIQKIRHTKLGANKIGHS